MTPRTFRIGGEHEVRRLGFGAMHLPTAPAAARETAVAVARRAVELGVTLIDTAHLYGWGANEELLAEALFPYPQGLLVATKVGVAPPTSTRDAVVCGRPEFLRDQVEQGLRRLRVERLDLLQLHRVDPDVPLADQLGALRELQDQGRIGHLGLSEITVAQLAEARQIIEVASVQNRYSLLDREHEAVLDACEAEGIAFLPWRPVLPAVSATAGDRAPSTAGDRAPSSGPAVVADIAAELGATAAQVSLAWLLDRSPVVLPIPGTGNLDHLAENVAAADLRLSADQRRRLDAISR
ncbi:aldo/keto reductase [Micromonosporaceae bacterium Da 78-11]